MPSAHIYGYPSVPLNLVGQQASQVIEHAKALLANVNTASLNSTAQEVGPIVYCVYCQ